MLVATCNTVPFHNPEDHLPHCIPPAVASWSYVINYISNLAKLSNQPALNLNLLATFFA
jgi:hypothetical protein